MSYYENYTAASKHYDSTRVAGGLNIILDNIPGPLTSARVLDSGAGTGNYALLMAPRVGHVTALEVDAGMLGRMREKIEATPAVKGRIDSMRWSLLDLPLPFEDGAFDAVVMNMVAHHLDKEAPYPNTRALIKEYKRVLKPEGRFIMSTNTAEQAPSKWFMRYNEDLPRIPFAPVDEIFQFCREARFEKMQRIPCKDLLQGLQYFNFAQVFDEGFRASNSNYGIMGDHIEEFLRRVEEDMKSGRFAEVVAAAERDRLKKGFFSFVIAE